MITIKKEMIKLSDNNNFLNEDYDNFVFGVKDLTVFIEELNLSIYIYVYSSIKIDQQKIIEKMTNLSGLKFKMLPTLLENHTYKQKIEFIYEIDDDNSNFDTKNIKLDDESIKFLEEIKNEADELLKETIEEQIKNHFEVN